MKGGNKIEMDKTMNKKGVYGMDSVQIFFGAILILAILAFVIIVIMGTLGGTNILSSATGTATENNKYINSTGYTLGQSTLTGFSGTITSIVNATDGITILSGNYTLTGNIVYNATTTTWDDVNISYSYVYNSDAQNQLNGIIGNTSSGVTGFFSSINPIYAILAILVIILVLVILIKVVQPNSGRRVPSL